MRRNSVGRRLLAAPADSSPAFLPNRDSDVYVSSPSKAPGSIRPLITPRLAHATDAIGEEVELLWAEDSWALCTAPLDAAPELLEQLIGVAATLEEAVEADTLPHLPSSGSPTPSDRRPHRPPPEVR